MKAVFMSFLFLFSYSLKANDCPLDFSNVSNLCAELEWIDGPHDGEKSHFEVSFYKKGDLSKTAVSPIHKVRIYSYMMMDSGHHHEGPKMTAKEIAPGVMEVRDARFFMQGMKGFWEVRIALSNSIQVLSTQSQKVELKP
jgi:hypothetical protein